MDKAEDPDTGIADANRVDGVEDPDTNTIEAGAEEDKQKPPIDRQVVARRLVIWASFNSFYRFFFLLFEVRDRLKLFGICFNLIVVLY